MNLCASVIVKNEADRYLRPFLEHLLDFCDTVRILDDGSTDDFREVGWFDDDRIQIMRNSTSVFMQHEGQARQALLDWTFAGDPTHVLAIDADEFVSDGQKVRACCEGRPSRQGVGQVWSLKMREVWTATDEMLRVREDGLWGASPVPILYELPPRRNAYRWRIANRAAAPGREPQAVAAMRQRARPSGSDILHFGWANVADRHDRWARYAGDNFGHNPTHIESIMYGDDRVRQDPYGWPEELRAYAAEIVARAQRGAGTTELTGRVDSRGGRVVPEMMFRDEVHRIPADTPTPSLDRLVSERIHVGTTADDFALYRKHPDGRWVGIRWDGTIETS